MQLWANTQAVISKIHPLWLGQLVIASSFAVGRPGRHPRLHKLCDLVPYHLGASLSSSVKWEWNLPSRVTRGLCLAARHLFPLLPDKENSKFPLANHSSPVGFPGGTSGQELTCQCRRHKRQGFHLWVRKILWRRARQPTAVFLPGESHGQRSLAGYSPWGCRVGQDWSNLTHMHVCIHYSLSSGLRLTQCLALRWPEWSNLVNVPLAPWS